LDGDKLAVINPFRVRPLAVELPDAPSHLFNSYRVNGEAMRDAMRANAANQSYANILTRKYNNDARQRHFMRTPCAVNRVANHVDWNGLANLARDIKHYPPWHPARIRAMQAKSRIGQ
jgi:hypothetical protein